MFARYALIMGPGQLPGMPITIEVREGAVCDPVIDLEPGQTLVFRVEIEQTGAEVARIPLRRELRSVEKILVGVDALDAEGVAHPGREVLTWQTIEAIAAFVQGDGTDVQRQALADGILAGRYRRDGI